MEPTLLEKDEILYNTPIMDFEGSNISKRVKNFYDESESKSKLDESNEKISNKIEKISKPKNILTQESFYDQENICCKCKKEKPKYYNSIKKEYVCDKCCYSEINNLEEENDSYVPLKKNLEVALRCCEKMKKTILFLMY